MKPHGWLLSGFVGFSGIECPVGKGSICRPAIRGLLQQFQGLQEGISVTLILGSAVTKMSFVPSMT